MKRLALLFGLLLVVAMLLVACGGDDAAPAEPAEIVVQAPDVTVQAPEVTVNVDTTAFEAALATISEQLDAIAEAQKPPVKEDKKDETGGGGDALACQLAEVINNPVYMLEKALDKNGEFKENKAGNPIMKRVANMSHMKEDYVCLDGDPIRVDGGNVFRLMYAQLDDDDEWRGLGADWYQCCFVDFEDVLRQ
jgi:hypothetical protein